MKCLDCFTANFCALLAKVWKFQLVGTVDIKPLLNSLYLWTGLWGAVDRKCI
jgi:hypothetical protein